MGLTVHQGVSGGSNRKGVVFWTATYAILPLDISAVSSLTLQCSEVLLPAGVCYGWRGGCKPEGWAERRSAASSLLMTVYKCSSASCPEKLCCNGRRGMAPHLKQVRRRPVIA